MRISLLLTGILFFFCIPAFSQEAAPGIYLTLDNETVDCRHRVKKYGGKESFCITDRPFITAENFLHVGEVHINPLEKIQYTDLWLTENSIRKLKTISAQLPNTKITLVVNNLAAGIFDQDLTGITGQFIRISDDLTSGMLVHIHRDLKTLVKYQSHQEMMTNRR